MYAYLLDLLPQASQSAQFWYRESELVWSFLGKVSWVWEEFMVRELQPWTANSLASTSLAQGLYLIQGCEYFFHICLGDSGITMVAHGTLHCQKLVFRDTTAFLRSLVAVLVAYNVKLTFNSSFSKKW